MNYDFTTWTTENLVDLLNYSGYNEDGIISAYYKDTTSLGQVTFNIDYENVDGEIESCNVYVFIKNGKLQAEF